MQIKTMRPRRFLTLAIQGAVIGVGAILPGISGGVLAVIFGIYRPMMELLAHPKTAFKKYIGMFIPVGIGWVLGFLGLARLVEILFRNAASVAICLFAGLVAGMLPSLFREAGKEGRGRSSYVALGLSTVLMLAFFLYLDLGATISVTPNVGWFFFCGAMWGISLVVPGMTSSSLLIFLGLYYPMTAGIAALDMGVVLPFVLGIGVTVLLLARLVNKLFEKHYAIAFHCILGFVIASTLPTIPRSYTSSTELILCIVCAVAGFFGAYWLDKWSNRVAAKAEH